MPERNLQDRSTLTPSQEAKMDELYERFKRAWLAGEKADIEE